MGAYMKANWKQKQIKRAAEMLKDMDIKDRDFVIDLVRTEGTLTKIRAKNRLKMSLLSEYTEEAIKKNENFGKMQGLSTGYTQLDELTKGLVPGELVVIAGKTSRGKSTLAINMTNKIALEGHNILFVTLEMTHSEVASKFLYMNKLDKYLQMAANVAFQEHDELDWQDIEPLVAKAVEEFNVELVVIDHLHYFTRELENVAEDLGRITKELKRAAIANKIPIILISHVRKTQDNKDANIEDLRGTSYIAQDADIVLMVNRKEIDEKKLLVKIEKNRNRGFDFVYNEIALSFDGVNISQFE